MKRRISTALVLFISLGMSVQASASTWNLMSAGNDKSSFYFDSDTVDKGKDGTVSLWIKTVQIRAADSDGSWATALRWKFNCPARTVQALSISLYDKNGAFIKSSSSASTPSLVVPDSVGEQVQKIACKSNFPNDTGGKDYWKLPNNDVFATTREYATFLDAQKDAAPK